MRDFRKYRVWQKAYALSNVLDDLTLTYPIEERFNLADQIRRAAGSIYSNIAEGCGQLSEAAFARFVQMAWGSANELEAHLMKSREKGYLDPTAAHRLIYELREVRRMLTGLLRTLRAAGSG